MSDGHYSVTEKASQSPSDLSENALLNPGLSAVFETLSHRSRGVILLLLKHEHVETKSDVMDRVDCDREEMDIALEHKHLPKLADAGYIEWDRETKAISKGPRFEEVDAFLGLIEGHSDELAPALA